jgi:tetratricopeptide (TPR) repeat protein
VNPEVPDRSSSEASRDSSQRIKPTTSATDTASTATQYKTLSNMAVEERRYRLERLPAPIRATLEGSPALPAQLLALASFVALGASEAGYFPTSWYLGALLWLALLATTTLALGAPRRLPKALLIAIALLGAYAIWAYVSIAWAGQRDVAWDGANRAAAYVLVFTLFAGWPLAERGARTLIAFFGLGIGGLGAVAVLSAGAGADPFDFFIGGRFSALIGYPSGASALYTMGLFACLFVATRRDGNPGLRGVALGSAGLLATLAYMTQSRGWLIAVPVAALAYFVLVPGRVRGLVAMAAIALSVLAIKGTTGAVYKGAAGERLPQLIDEAVRASLLAAAALAVAGLVLALIDRRVEPPPSLTARVPAWAPLAVVLALLGATAVVFVALPGPRDRVETVWSDFKANSEPPPAGESRFASGGTNRYDFWTVAWDLFRENPVKGIGVENFQEDYLQRGTSGEEPRFPHSLPLGLLSQTGLVGALLLGGALALALFCAAGARRAPPGSSAAAAGAVAVFAPWLVQASIDWFWELPALTGSALAMLGAAAALGTSRPGAPARAPRRLAPALLVAVPALLLALAFGATWLAARDVEAASSGWRADAEASFRRLDRAATLSPLSPRAYLVEGTIALELGRNEQARSAFEAALERDSGDAYALLELGLLASQAGERERAIQFLERHRRLQPRDPIARQVAARARHGEKLDPEAVNARLLRRVLLRQDRPVEGP